MNHAPSRMTKSPFSLSCLKRLALAALLAVMSAACATMHSAIKTDLQNEGEVYLFRQPQPAEAKTIALNISTCSIASSDGTEYSFATASQEPDSAPGKQRFLASFRVPPGRYNGISCIVRAGGNDQDGNRPHNAEERVLMPFSLEVGLKKAVVLWLEIQAAVPDAAPSLRLSIPKTPASGLLGYVPNSGDNTITVFDKKTGDVTSVIETGSRPESVAFDPTTNIAFVALAGDDAIEALDITQGIVTRRLNLNMGDGPSELLLTPDKRTLITLNRASRTVGILDAASLTEISRIAVGEGPRRLLLGRDGVRCYVFNEFSNTISVIDIANRAPVTTLSTESGPLMGQFNRKGDRLYVIFRGSPYLSVIDSRSLSLVKRVFVGTGLRAIKVDPTTDLLYAYRHGDARIEIYDPLSLTPGDSLMGMPGVVVMTIDGESNALVLVSAEKKKLASVSLISKKVVAETDTGDNPAWITLMGER